MVITSDTNATIGHRLEPASIIDHRMATIAAAPTSVANTDARWTSRQLPESDTIRSSSTMSLSDLDDARGWMALNATATTAETTPAAAPIRSSVASLIE